MDDSSVEDFAKHLDELREISRIFVEAFVAEGFNREQAYELSTEMLKRMLRSEL